MDVEFMTIKSIILSVAFSLPSCIHSIAFIPSGVAAPPIPKRFAEKLSVIYSSARSLSPLNNFFVNGLNSLLRALLSPMPSISESMDNHIAYIAISVNASVSALLAPLIIMENALSGETTTNIISDANIIMAKTVFIIKVLPYEIV